MEQLLYNATIRTLTAPDADCPQALLVRDGRIAALGRRAELQQTAPHAEPVDLGGGALLPAFLDAHSHFSACANGFLQVQLTGCRTWAQVEERVRRFIAENRLAPGRWVLGNGWDLSAMEERALPPLALLDRAAPQNPLALGHASGHTGLMNSAALAVLGITPQTPDPEGGAIGRKNGRLTGYLEENAYIGAVRRAPMPAMDDLLRACRRAARYYASFGVTVAQEGMAVRQLIPLFEQLARSQTPRPDLVAYADQADADALYVAFPQAAGRLHGGLMLAGHKIFLDGSPQAGTAWMQSEYQGRPGYCGYPAMTDAAVRQAVRRALDQRVQLLAHCNGDAAAQQFLEAIEAECGGPAPEFLRPVMIHAQLLRPDQLPQLARLGVTPSFFVAHVHHWGAQHIQNFGLPRAAQISPAGSALALGLPFTFHQDTPVLPPDMLHTVWCAVCRRLPDGQVLGAEQRIPVYEALRAVTANAARQYGLQAELGTLRPGARADLVLLSGDPMALPPEQLPTLRVRATCKAGQLLWSEEGGGLGSCP